VILDLTEGLCPGLAQGGMAASVDVALLSLTEGNSLLSTGEGGALLSNDEGLMRMALSYQRFADLKGLLPGINQKMSAMQASLGLHRLERLGDDDGLHGHG
jgi:dTDP-4-amino-4,6-dideoxygalactose transaminase